MSNDTPKTPQKPGKFLIFITTDGFTLKRIGAVMARSAEEAVNKHIAEVTEDGKHVSASTSFEYVAAISENYFKLRKPMPKVVTKIALEDVDWDSFKTPQQPVDARPDREPTAA